MRCLRGDGFQQDHWRDLFKLAELDPSISAESLKLSHFLEKVQVLIDKADELKALHMRAQVRSPMVVVVELWLWWLWWGCCQVMGLWW